MDWHEGFQSVVARLVFKWKRYRFLSEKDRQKLLINLNLMRITGKTYLKIPVESKNTVEQALHLLGQFMKGMGE